MRRRIDISEARALLRSRAQLQSEGLSDRQIAHLVTDGTLIRLHRGIYVFGVDWSTLWPEGQHLLQVLAVHAASLGPGPVFTHASAAVLHGFPLAIAKPPPVQTLASGRRHSRVEAGVVRRDMAVADADIVEIDGIRATSAVRTVFDIARTARLEVSVACADAALRAVAVHGRAEDAEAAAAWRDAGLALARPGLRGVRRARWVFEFADGRAERPGESVSRLQLHRLGFTNLDAQIHVVGSAGDDYWVDFGFLCLRVFGEFDGDEKYLNPDMRAAPTAEQAVMLEKRREDDIRGVTGWRFARWGHAHVRTADALGARLRAFRVYPPG